MKLMATATYIRKMRQHLQESIDNLKSIDVDFVNTCDHIENDGTLAVTSKYPGTSWEPVAICTACGRDSITSSDTFKHVKYIAPEERRKDPGRDFTPSGIFVKVDL